MTFTGKQSRPAALFGFNSNFEYNFTNILCSGFWKFKIDFIYDQLLIYLNLGYLYNLVQVQKLSLQYLCSDY